MTGKKISVVSRFLLWTAAVLLVMSLFVPIWQIDLDAPQYPEGLSLQIWANKIAGDVDIINGLNHYIGMKTLHSEDFIEFTLLPFLVVFFVLLFSVSAFKANKKWLHISFFAFVIFGLVAMIDFWKWEYDYGHHLDPNAAIKVPGMSYQPPLIGFKQLLNFGAYSAPAVGGWLFVAAGLLVLIAIVKENNLLKKISPSRSARTVAVFSSLTIVFYSCVDAGPQAIHLHSDPCDFCRMTISDGRLATELITKKGRIYKFDDLVCMLEYRQEQKPLTRKYYVSDYTKPNTLIDADNAWFIRHDSLKTPMGGNIVAFASKQTAIEYAARLNAVVESWTKVEKMKLSHLSSGSYEKHP